MTWPPTGLRQQLGACCAGEGSFSQVRRVAAKQAAALRVLLAGPRLPPVAFLASVFSFFPDRGHPGALRPAARPPRQDLMTWPGMG